MAAGAPPRQPRRGPAPIASFDHDGSDESSPESKLTARLPEIREHAAGGGAGEGLAPAPAGEPRARSHSTPACGALAAPPAPLAPLAPLAPRIDISRASSSSHHDSRDSSPELALFAGGGGGARLELAFREDGALDLRSSTEELSFLEPAPGETVPAPPPARSASASAAAPPPPPAPPHAPAPAERRHSRKDSQCSEAALLAVSGRTSRLSSVGSQCSAVSALSRISRLSVASGASRSPSPHRMLLETSFCGPKPIETDPEISAGALVEQILGMVRSGGGEAAVSATATPAASPPAPAAAVPSAPIDARDRREVRTEVTVESARTAPVTPPTQVVTVAVPPPTVTVAVPPPAAPPEAPPPDPVDSEKNAKEIKNRTRTEDRKARPRMRREPSEPEVYKSRNKSKDIIIIKLRPDDSYEEEQEERPATLALGLAARPAEPAPPPALPSPAPSRRRSPSPAGAPVSRKSSFCSLFKSRETIASPESPSEALRRKRSLTEGRSRSKSRDRSATPTSACKIRGSVLSLFRTPRRSGASTSPGSREGSPGVPPAPAAPALADRRRADKLKYYEDAKDGIIHIPLRTPPDERGSAGAPRRSSGGEAAAEPAREPRPASAPQRALPDRASLLPDPPQPSAPPAAHKNSQIHSKAEPRLPASSRAPSKPIHRTVLPDGSIIIPLHSPTERPTSETDFPEIVRVDEPSPVTKPVEETRAITNRAERSIATASPTRGWEAVAGAASDASPPRGRDAAPLPATPATPATPTPAEPPAPVEDTRRRRKERLVFTTHVGSREQVFSTQFSITKTPSVTSEISGSFPSFAESEDVRPPAPVPTLRDTRIAADEPAPAPAPAPAAAGESAAGTPQDAPRDSSESEPSSEAAPSRAGNDVEKRGLVVQESFEEELPYVPTTLPQERSVALPMVPVRERGGVRVSGVQRPRAAAPPPARAPAPAPAPAPPPPADKLRIRLPRRPRPTPAPAPAPASAAPRAERPRTRSGSDSGGEARAKAEWIDFEEVPERRKQPKRIQMLPAEATGGGGGGSGGSVVFSYVEPEHCRCECHAHARHDADDHLPLLRDDMHTSRISSSSAECGSSPQSPAEAGTASAPTAPELAGPPAPRLHAEPAQAQAQARQ